LFWAGEMDAIASSNSAASVQRVKPINIGLPPERGNAILVFRIVQHTKIEAYQDGGKSRLGGEFS
jgi:hypothetical protein